MQTGTGYESDSNPHQLLHLKSESDCNLAAWLKHKENVYTSPDIQNELIKLMGIKILRSISKKLQNSAFLATMADETTNLSIMNNLSLCFNVSQITYWCMKNF